MDEYKIGKDGYIINIKSGRILIPDISKTGYHRVTLFNNGKYNRQSVHRLVAITHIPNPLNLPEVNHIDGKKENNYVSNLEWCSSSYNKKHAFKMGLRYTKGENHPSNKINEKLVLEIRKKYMSGKYSQYKLAKEYNVTQSNISCIVLRKSWKHI